MSPLLGETDHIFYQMILGMDQWLNTIGCPDVYYICCSLSRYGLCPRGGHFKMVLHLFGYIKNVPNRRIPFDSRDIDFKYILDDTSKLHLNFLADYLDTFEEMDRYFL